MHDEILRSRSYVNDKFILFLVCDGFFVFEVSYFLCCGFTLDCRLMVWKINFKLDKTTRVRFSN